MTSTTETETKVETQASNKEETLNKDNVDAVKEQADKPAEQNSAPASPTKKTGTLKNAITVHKKDFENEIVYVYQFVRTPTLPSLSACCLKVENFLRMNGIQYENIVHNMRFKSKKGGLPFVEINGKEIDEADNIIRELSNHFSKDLNEGLTEEQKTLSHAFESMLDNHTGWIARWWRYNNPQEFLDTAQLDIKRTFNSRLPNSILNFVFKLGFRKHLKDAVGGYGLGRFTPEEVLEAAKNDLKALSSLLGTQDYFFGKEPHLLDSSAFSHLVQFIYVPFGGLKEFIETETPNLLALVDRFKAKYWSDWDKIISTLEMNTHLPEKEGAAEAAAAEEEAKKQAEAKKAEKKRLAEEKKKEREEKKKKEKEEKERQKKEKEEAAKAAKEKAAAEAEAAKQAAAEKAEKEKAEQPTENAAPAEAAAETKEAEKQETAPNGGEATKPAEVTASE